MGFHNVTLPSAFARGYSAGPGFDTKIQETGSGHEKRIINRVQEKRAMRGDVRWLRDQPVAELLDFYIARRGAAYAFRVKDLSDFTTALDHRSAPTHQDVVIGIGDGSKTQFQLSKVYGVSSPLPKTRLLKCPVANTVLVAKDGAPAAGWTVNSVTGIVTFSVAPALGVVVTAGCEFDVPVRFSKTLDTLFAPRMTAFQVNDLLSLELVEVLDETEFSEARTLGGSKVYESLGADVQISPTEAGIFLIEPTTTIKIYMVPPSRLPGGHMMTVFVESGSAGTITLVDDTGATISGPHSAGAVVQIALFNDGSNAFWRSW